MCNTDMHKLGPLPSRAFSHARGHFRLSRVSLDGLRKKTVDLQRSKPLISLVPCTSIVFRDRGIVM